MCPVGSAKSLRPSGDQQLLTQRGFGVSRENVVDRVQISVSSPEITRQAKWTDLGIFPSIHKREPQLTIAMQGERIY